MNFGEVVALVIGFLLPSRWIVVPLVAFIARVAGQAALNHYINEHFYKDKHE